MEQYKETVESARSALPIAVEMEQLFPTADHFITHFGFDDKPRQWNTEVFFGGRYTLTMQVDVEIDYRKNRIVKVVGVPKFYLVDAEKIEVLPDSRVSVSYNSQNERKFGPSEWQKIYDQKGDLSAINFNVNPVPVENFDYYVMRVQTPRVPRISLIKR